MQPHSCDTTFTTSQWIRDKILSRLALLTETQAIYPAFFFFPGLIFFIKFWRKINKIKKKARANQRREGRKKTRKEKGKKKQWEFYSSGQKDVGAHSFTTGNLLD